MNLAIAVATKGRAYMKTNATLAWLSKLKLNIPVYLYTHKQETKCYKELYPEYEIIEHPFDFLQCKEYRAYIQEHHYSMNNHVIVMDDDIASLKYMEPGNDIFWEKSFLTLLEEIKKDFEDGADLLYSFRSTEDDIPFYRASVDKEYNNEYTKDGNWHTYIATLMAYAPSLYDKGVKIRNSPSNNEDDYLSVEPYVRDCDVRKMNVVYYSNYEAGVISNFIVNNYVRYIIQTYLHYGAVFNPIRFINGRGFWNKDVIELYKKHGRIATPLVDDILEDIIEENKPGSDYLRIIGWKREDNYNEKLVKIIDTIYKEKIKNDFTELKEKGVIIAPSNIDPREEVVNE